MTVIEAAPHPSAADRRAQGVDARARTPREAHTHWQPGPEREDPVAILQAQDATREPDLVPVRHGRMMVSPFTFYRGSAAIMAADLAITPTAGLNVQLCGDAHLSNFGVFASPERQLLFDLNDFDETLPGPFEYDVKRLAASFAIAAANNKFSAEDTQQVVLKVGESYRTAMAGFAKTNTLDIWYSRMSEADIQDGLVRLEREYAEVAKQAKRAGAPKSAIPSIERGREVFRKARTRTNLQALSKLTEVVDGRQRIVSQPPVLIPWRELEMSAESDRPDLFDVVQEVYDRYRGTLNETRRRLLDRYRVVDAARKVVGVGSVGTRAFIVLLEGRDAGDPLFLQVKEATKSVLEAHLPKSQFATSGERVVQGQQMMQSASDIFLGWSEGVQDDRFYYWRQLRDMKGSVPVEELLPPGLTFYAEICGWTLARAHARSGDPVAIAAYLGTKRKFDRAIAEFAKAYAKQNEQDYQAFLDAINSGRLEAKTGV